MSTENNWIYKTSDEKRQLVRKIYNIVTIDDVLWVECFKAVRYDYRSIHSPDKFIYNILDHLYETDCEYDANKRYAKGFGCWTKEGAIDFAGRNKPPHKIIKVRVPLDKICMLSNGKIRAEEMIITEL
jgi:hypothetical protein